MILRKTTKMKNVNTLEKLKKKKEDIHGRKKP